MTFTQFIIDAFTDKVFGGNPAAVVLLNEWLPDAQLLQIAAENNLSETAFLVPQGEDYHLRWFTPVVEIDLCGHATLASAHALFAHQGYDRPYVNFHTQSGVLTVERTPQGYRMRFPAQVPDAVEMNPLVVEGLGKAPRELWAANDYIAVFDTAAEIDALSPTMEPLRQLDRRALIVTAPLEKNTFVCRFFAPKLGIPEDPVTGSSFCQLAPYWAARFASNDLHVIQVSARRGEAQLQLDGEHVLISGNAKTFSVGQIRLD